MINKTKIQILIQLILVGLATAAAGQTFQVQDNRSLSSTGEEKIYSVQLLDNDYLLAVGTIEETGEAVIRIIDTNTGQLEKRAVIGSAHGGGFLSVTEADDASIYVVGYQYEDKRQRDRNPWWIRFDERLNILSEEVLDLPDDNYFEKITWMDNGQGMIGGWKSPAKNGNVWIRTIDSNTLQDVDTEVGAGRWGQIIGLYAVPGERVWLCGNSQKAKAAKEGDIWYCQLDANGQIKYANIKETSHTDELFAAFASVDGRLLLGGERWKKSSLYGEAVLFEVNAEGQMQPATILSNSISRRVAALHYLPEIGTKAILQSEENSGHQLLDVEQEETEDLPLGQVGEFETLPLMLNRAGHYLLAGIAYPERGRSSHLELLTAAFSIYPPPSSQSVAAKGSPMSITEEVLKASLPILEDDDKDGVLSVNEQGVVAFYLENVSATDNLYQVEVIVEGKCPGIQFLKPVLFEPQLPKKTKLRMSIPIRRIEDVKSGAFTIVVKVQGKEVFQFIAPIDGRKIGDSTKIGPTQLINPGIRERITEDGTYEIRFVLLSSKHIRDSDIKVFSNVKSLVDGKLPPPRLEEKGTEGGKQKWHMVYNVFDLIEGDNEFQFEVDGSRAEVVVRYEPSRPNLHLLSVGPHYDDLKFTSKDARDFTEMFLSKAQNGLFSQVVTVDTLFEAANTTQLEIESAFNRLYQRYEAGLIKSTDYVVVYISAHGIKLADGYRLLPSGYDKGNLRPTSIHYQKDLLDYLDRVKCKKIIFIDACLSGAVQGDKSISAEDLNQAIMLANQSLDGVVAFSSSAATQKSFEYEKGQNGLFTEALLEAMSGLADAPETPDGVITLQEIIDYLERRVPELAKDIELPVPQRPAAGGDLRMDLPLIIKDH